MNKGFIIGAAVLLLTDLVAAGAIAAIETVDYKINKAKKLREQQKMEDEKEGVVWTIDACDVVEIYRNCEVV